MKRFRKTVLILVILMFDLACMLSALSRIVLGNQARPDFDATWSSGVSVDKDSSDNATVTWDEASFLRELCYRGGNATVSLLRVESSCPAVRAPQIQLPIPFDLDVGWQTATLIVYVTELILAVIHAVWWHSRYLRFNGGSRDNGNASDTDDEPEVTRARLTSQEKARQCAFRFHMAGWILLHMLIVGEYVILATRASTVLECAIAVLYGCMTTAAASLSGVYYFRRE